MNFSTGLGSKMLSADAKQKKLDEAHFLCEKGEKLITTSIFKWSADHLAAAPAFEKSAQCYVAVGDLNQAKAMYQKAAESQQKYDAYGSAAVSLMKAAQIAQNQGKSEESADLYESAAQNWLLNGENEKGGDSLIRAAKAVEESNSSRAWSIYLRAIDTMFPDNMSDNQITSVPAMTIDAMRDILKFLLKGRLIKQALIFLPRMIALYSLQGYESLMCKAMVTLTFLQLEIGDVVLADKTFVQDHLSSSLYLRSPECKLAEDFITAFKNMDPTQLETVQSARELGYLDFEVQQLAKGLSLMRQKRENPPSFSPSSSLLPPPPPSSSSSSLSQSNQMIFPPPPPPPPPLSSSLSPPDSSPLSPSLSSSLSPPAPPIPPTLSSVTPTNNNTESVTVSNTKVTATSSDVTATVPDKQPVTMTVTEQLASQDVTANDDDEIDLT